METNQIYPGTGLGRKSSVLTCPKECWNSVYGVPYLIADLMVIYRRICVGTHSGILVIT